MLSVHNLTCRRSSRVVFRDLVFKIAAGGFLRVTGANGSGKSSLLRMLAGLIAPEAGIISWQESDIAQDPYAYRNCLHYVGHHDAVKPGLTLREMLGYWRALQDAEWSDDKAALDAFDLGSLIDHPVRSLSAGQKRRLSLTRLVLCDAPLWLLDEPTAALDVASQKILISQIAQHRAKGGIVIAATHDVLDVADAQHLDMSLFARAAA